MKKRLFSLMLTLCFIFNLIPFGVQAAEVLASGTCGENLTWVLTDDGTLTISGEGEMTSSPWSEYNYEIVNVEFEGNLTSIARYAFRRAENLMRISIPDSVEKIGTEAFYCCYSLEEVNLPIGLTSIDACAFMHCTSLREIVIPDDTQSIGRQAFAGCSNLDSITIPEHMIGIDGTAFDNTLWQNNQTGYVIVGDGVLIHHSYEESSEELQNIRFVIPDGVKYISNDFFIYDEKDYAVTASVMDDIEFPDGLIEIGTDSFYRYNGTTLRFPASVKKIGCESGRGYSVFQNSPNLTSVYFYGDAPMIGRGVFQMYSGGRSVNQIPTLYYIEGTSGWTDSDAYDPETGTWNGYPLTSFEPETTEPEPTDPAPTEPEPTEPDPTDPEPTDPIDPEPVENPFTDVAESNFFYEPVLWAVDNGITSGVSATRFAPNDPCTRAQVVTFLWRAAGEPQPTSTKNPFTDVKASAYYYDAVLWAVEEGITTGMSTTSFGPNSPCTRGQVVTFLHRATGETEPESTRNPFTDVKETGFYYDAVLWAVENSITTGTSATKFSPNQTCTRGQVVTFLYRAD